MSFNRGAKRNNFGNRNFNRNSGGMGNMTGRNNTGGGSGGPMGGGLGGGSGGGGGGSGGVNPWESGMMPGRGLLPTPNNNLSLSSPQAQLVIASNLLSNLLRTQQEVQPQLLASKKVPSLLSLGNTLNGPGPNFGGQQNFGPGRFNDGPMRHPMKNQRQHPYNKMGNRARDGVAGRRGPSAQQSRAPQSGNQRINGNQIQHRNDKTSKPNPASKQNQTEKKEQQEVKTSDKEKAETHVAKSDESEGSEEKKRDWKDEKKEGEVSQMDVSETEDKSKESITEDTEKSNASDKKTEDGQAAGKKSATRHAESRYSAVPMSHMFCHVCNKHMWDGFSFENHLRGRSHQLMMDKLDESYKLKVDLMRHELRVAEEQRELSLTNSKRRGKKVSVDLNVREYCTMCDLNFFGTLSSHRKSDKHQQLKTFLHPRCFPCMKEFPSRIEYDEHCLTPGHMKNSAQSEEQRKNKKKDKLAKGESEVRTAEDEEKDVQAADAKSTEKEEELPENTEYLTDITDDMPLTNYKIPSLKHCRQNQISVGKSMVKEVNGYHCEKCRRFMMTETDMAAHLRSITHYRNFVQEVKTLTAAKTETATEATPETTTEKNVEVKDEEDDDYEGDWKRRKVDHSKDEDESIKKESAEDSTADESVSSKKPDGDEKYDPLEADAESEEDVRTHEKSSNDQAPNENVEDNQEEDTPVEKMWADIDNDNDPEIGNLIDDDNDEKEHQEPQKEQPLVPTPQQAQPTQQQQQQQPQPTQQQQQQQQPQPTQQQAQSTQQQQQQQQQPAQQQQQQQQTPQQKQQPPPQQQQQQQQQQAPAQEELTAEEVPKVEKPAPIVSPQVKLSPTLNSPQVKTPRGRGCGRGRGMARARRSRR